MKKNLFWQDIYTVFAALLITVLVVICTTGVLGAALGIPMKDGKLSQDVIVLKNDVPVYSTRELSGMEIENLLITLKDKNMRFVIKGVAYTLSEKTFADGTRLIQLSPAFTSGDRRKLAAVFCVFAFLAVYVLIALYVQKKRENEIIEPISEVMRQTERMTEGDFDVNIPDVGMDEIKELASRIEALRLRLKKEIYINKKAAESRKFLISSMSHDLRTPVTALKGYLEGILDGVADTEEKRRMYVEKSLEKTELISHMISDLLLYSRLDQNQVEFKYQVIDICEYLAALAEENRVIFKRQKKEIVFESGEVCACSVRVDVEQLDRVMGNVIENALRYTEEGKGRVEILLRETGSGVIAEVKDNGAGVSEEDLPKIFDRFYRGEKSRQIKGSSGLGLAISKQIIENMGGLIWATGKSGEGMSILISLKKCNGEAS